MNKSKWTPDSSASVCSKCLCLFTALQRRHHCRSCGQVFCNSCSSSRTPLPDLGYDSPVRVCKCCFDINAYSILAKDNSRIADAARGLAELTKDGPAQINMVEQGCVELLNLLLSRANDEETKESVCIAFANLAQNAVHRPKLAEAGIARTLAEFLVNEAETIGVRCEAARGLSGMACFENGSVATSLDPSMASIIELTKSSVDSRLRWLVSDLLANLSGNPAARDNFISAGGIQTIISLALSEDPPLQILSCTSMLRLCEAGTKYQADVVENGAVLPLMMLLSSSNDDVLEHATRVISTLAENRNNRVQLVQSGIVPPLVEVLAHPNVGVQLHSSRCISYLSSNPENWDIMSDPEVLVPLLKLMSPSFHTSAQEHLAAALGNLVGHPAARAVMSASSQFLERVSDMSKARISGTLLPYSTKILESCKPR